MRPCLSHPLLHHPKIKNNRNYLSGLRIRETVIIQFHVTACSECRMNASCCFNSWRKMEGQTDTCGAHKTIRAAYFLTACSHENGISHNKPFNHLLNVPISQYHHHHSGNQISTWVWRGQTTRKQSAVKFQYRGYKRSDLTSNKVMGSAAASHLSMWDPVEAAWSQPLHSFSTAQHQVASGCLTAPKGAWRRLFRCVLFSGTMFMSR